MSKAAVWSEGVCLGEIRRGYVVLLGVSNTDTKEHADKLVDKIARLRIFEDENGKTNLSAADVNGAILIVSQFTLYADTKKGNRPSFINAGSPALANELYEYFIATAKTRFVEVANGSFGAHMEIKLVNDGPFTLILDTDMM